MDVDPIPTRRQFLTDAAVSGSALLLAGSAGLVAAAPAALPNGEFIRTIRFSGSRRGLERLTGTGWHGRFTHDLSLLTAKTLITPTDRFYIRTRCSKQIGDTENWKIALHEVCSRSHFGGNHGK